MICEFDGTGGVLFDIRQWIDELDEDVPDDSGESVSDGEKEDDDDEGEADSLSKDFDSVNW